MASHIHQPATNSKLRNKGNSKNEIHGGIQITLKRIEDLTEDPTNPRIHSPKQIRQIAQSMEAFGFNVPILVDASGKVLAGHGRLAASRLLGWAEVPTIALNHLTEAQAKAFQIADNRLTETSTWDERLLGEQFKALSLVDLDFSLEATGFHMGEIDLYIQGLEIDPSASGTPDPADELPALPSSPPVTQPGDLWALGPHRLLCGNALEADALAELMQGQKAAAVFSDPPYNVPIHGHVGGLGKVQHREFAMASGEMSKEQFADFLLQAFRGMAACTHGGALLFICMDWRGLLSALSSGEKVGWELKNLCAWVKDLPGMGSLYRSQHELVLVFKQGTAAHRNNVQLGQFGRSRSNVWRYPGMNSFGRSGEEGNLAALHPTVKPVALVADALLDCTERGDLVLDPFLGSGTTLLAAERVGRICHGLELDPIYVDTAIRRWQSWTGGTALRMRDGVSFNVLAQSGSEGPHER